jgi:hypothetical protein
MSLNCFEVLSSFCFVFPGIEVTSGSREKSISLAAGYPLSVWSEPGTLGSGCCCLGTALVVWA